MINMDFNFWIIQGIGVLACLVLLVSYYRNDTNKILFFHTIAAILYCIHYYLLGAYTALFICVFEVIRDYLYYKTDLDNYIFVSSIPIYVVNGFITFTGWYDLLPALASFIDGYRINKKRESVVLWSIVTYTAWVIYDLFVMSYSCAIMDSLIVLSNLSILLFDFNPFEFKKKGKQSFSIR